MPTFYNMLIAPNSTDDDVTNSVAFFNAVLPHCSEGVFSRGFAQITPIYAQKSSTTDLALQ